MAKKKATKEIKRLKQKVKKAESAYLMLENRVRKLKKKLRARKQQIADLQGRLGETRAIIEAKSTSTAEIGSHDETNIASSHRSAWKRHSYLRDRYEFHLSAGAPKKRARHLANEDLQHAYGADCGYTDEELSAILS